MTTNLRTVLETHVGKGAIPGAVALVARGDRVEVEAVGSVDVDGTAPMARDSIFRIASITKPITAAAVMMLVEDGRIALDDPVEQLAAGAGRRRWSSARRPARSTTWSRPPGRSPWPTCSPSAPGYGFPSDFSLPAVRLLFSELQQGPPQPQLVAAPDEWMAALARIPLLHQPGEAWLYNTCSDIQGVLVARVSGRPLPEFLAERLFEPLGMVDTGFDVPADKLDRFTSYYRRGRTAASSWPTPPTGSGAARPRSRPAPAGWSRPSTTGSPSPGCCSPTGSSTAAGCCRRRRCGR